MPKRLLLLMPLLLGLAGPAPARHDSLDEAVSEARSRYDGRVLSAETLRDEEGRETYNVRILTPEGRVRRYRVRPEEGHRPRGREERWHRERPRREYRFREPRR